MTYEPSHPRGCAVFGCTDHACFGFGVTKTDPGVWVCGSSLHRAWAVGFLQARSTSKGSSRAAAPEPPRLTPAQAADLLQVASRAKTLAKTGAGERAA